MDEQDYLAMRDEAAERIMEAAIDSAILLGEGFSVVEGYFGLGLSADTALLRCSMLMTKTDDECLADLCRRARGFVDTCPGGTLQPYLISATRDGRCIFWGGKRCPG